MNSMDHNVLQNFLYMLQDRGYESIESTTEGDQVSVTAVSSINKKMRGRFITGLRLNIGTVKDIINDFVTSEAQHGIIVYDGMPTSQGKKMLQNLDGTGTIRVETFPSVFFKSHKPIHKLVRPHIKLKKKEADAVKKEYGVKLPILLSSDPMTRYYDFRTGDIVKIIRRNNAIAYRLVK